MAVYKKYDIATFTGKVQETRQSKKAVELVHYLNIININKRT